MDQRPDVVGIVRRGDIGLLDILVDVGGSRDAVDVGSKQRKEPEKMRNVSVVDQGRC